MQCPVDGTVLMMSQREGVEIDYCPQCRGVWLDRGELDKIIERSAPSGGRASLPTRGSDGYDDDARGSREKRRGSFLGDIFDF